MKWKKYDKPSETLSSLIGAYRKAPETLEAESAYRKQRYEKQLRTTIERWVHGKPNSLISVAKALRELQAFSGKPMTYAQSIKAAQEFGQGKLQ